MLGQVAAAGPKVPNMSRKSSHQVLSPLILLPIFSTDFLEGDLIIKAKNRNQSYIDFYDV